VFKLLYNAGAVLGALLLQAGALFVPRWKTLLKSRKNAAKPSVNSPIKVWFHCASLGEYEMILPLARRASEKYSHNRILITIFSDSGYTYAEKKEFGNQIMYLPFDTLREVKQFYKEYEPETAVLVRYELWYNLLRLGLHYGTQFYLVNTRFNTDHFLFKWYAKPYQSLLKQFNQLFSSDTSTIANLHNAGFSNATYVGDTRFDAFNEKKNKAPIFPKIEAFIGDQPTLILGSSWEEEEIILEDALKSGFRGIKIILAPHQVNRSQEIVNRFKEHQPVLYSEYQNQETQILVINNIGMLSALYQYAQFAFVGGGFSGKLHNTIEPAVWGNLIAFGPKISKFSEAQSFEKEGFALKIESGKDLKKWIETHVHNPNLIDEKKRSALSFVENNLGANAQIASKLKL
jgi:3-deoxy-D-manno-octulosonic-acid transferase